MVAPSKSDNDDVVDCWKRRRCYATPQHKFSINHYDCRSRNCYANVLSRPQAREPCVEMSGGVIRLLLQCLVVLQCLLTTSSRVATHTNTAALPYTQASLPSTPQRRRRNVKKTTTLSNRRGSTKPAVAVDDIDGAAQPATGVTIEVGAGGRAATAAADVVAAAAVAAATQSLRQDVASGLRYLRSGEQRKVRLPRSLRCFALGILQAAVFSVVGGWHKRCHQSHSMLVGAHAER